MEDFDEALGLDEERPDDELLRDDELDERLLDEELLLEEELDSEALLDEEPPLEALLDDDSGIIQSLQIRTREENSKDYCVMLSSVDTRHRGSVAIRIATE